MILNRKWLHGIAGLSVFDDGKFTQVKSEKCHRIKRAPNQIYIESVQSLLTPVSKKWLHPLLSIMGFNDVWATS